MFHYCLCDHKTNDMTQGIFDHKSNNNNNKKFCANKNISIKVSRKKKKGISNNLTLFIKRVCVPANGIFGLFNVIN